MEVQISTDRAKELAAHQQVMEKMSKDRNRGKTKKDEEDENPTYGLVLGGDDDEEDRLTRKQRKGNIILFRIYLLSN